MDQPVALHSDGTVRAWGNNYFGQLGDGTTTTRNTPVAVSGLSDVTAITAGSDHSLAVAPEPSDACDEGGTQIVDGTVAGVRYRPNLLVRGLFP